MILESKKCCALNDKPWKVSFISIISFLFPVYILSTVVSFICKLLNIKKIYIKTAPLSFITFRMINSSMFVNARRSIVRTLLENQPICAVIFNTYFNIFFILLLYSVVIFILWRFL